MFRAILGIFTYRTERAALGAGLGTLFLVVVLNALDAVAAGPVPLEWLGHMWIIVTAVLLFPYLTRTHVPGVTVFGGLIFWALFVQAINLIGCASVTNCARMEMPEGATTNYSWFVVLRYFVLLAFIAAMMLTAWLARHGKREQIVWFVLNFGVVIATVALYIYVAQLGSLPDIPRNRLGTDGQAVTEVVFSYSFHRALGTFREPSQLAVWLVLPFFLSFTYGRGILNWRAVLIGSVLLLSGSVTGFLAICVGALTSLVYLLVRGVRGAGWLMTLPLKAVAAVALALVPFRIIARGYETGGADLWTALLARMIPVYEYGVAESNRGYVYDYANEVDIPILGAGLANSNLEFTRWMQLDAVAGFLSLYVNILMSLGVIGLALLLTFLGRPLFVSLRGVHARDAWPLFAAYFAWLVIFLAHASEFPLMFAVTYALLATTPWQRTAPEAVRELKSRVAQRLPSGAVPKDAS